MAQLNRFFRNLPLATRIALLTSVAVFLIGVFIYVYILPKIEKHLWDEKLEQVRHIVELGQSTVKGYASLARQGVLSPEEAKKRAIEAVQSMRFDDDNYLWINDYNTVILSHPKAELVGKPQTDYRDPNGKRVFVEAVNICQQQGEGYFEYVWNKPNSTKASPKLSYVKNVSEWNWVVGSGIYIDSVEEQINSLVYSILLSVALITLGMVFLSLYIGKKLVQPILDVTEHMKNADINSQF